VTPDASEQPVWQGATGRHSGVTGRIRDGAVAERESEQEHECAKQGGANVEPIAQSEAAPNTAEILERWRAVERQLDDLEPGSPESVRLFAEFERLRDEYLAVFRERESTDPK
jgi:hypothetical protein